MTDPQTTLDVYNYDAEKDADMAISAHLGKKEALDVKTGVTDRELDKLVAYWWPKQGEPLQVSKL